MLLHIRAPTPGGRWNTSTVQPEQALPQPAHHQSIDLYSLAEETWRAKRILIPVDPSYSGNEEEKHCQRPEPTGNAQTRDGLWKPSRASSRHRTHQESFMKFLQNTWRNLQSVVFQNKFLLPLFFKITSITHVHSLFFRLGLVCISRVLLSPPRVRYPAFSLPILGQKTESLESGIIYIITTLTVLFLGSARCIMRMCDWDNYFYGFPHAHFRNDHP